LLEAVFGVVLHTLELQLKLLVTILELLDGAGQLTQRAFHTVEPDGHVAGIRLRHPALRLLLRLRRCARLRRRFAAAEKIIEKIARRTLLLGQRGTGQKQRQRGESRKRKRR
jgi:hypothetical protein